MSEAILARKAEIHDAQPIHDLINLYAQRGDMLPRTMGEVYENLRDFDVWKTEAPPKGVIYNYPPRGDVESIMIGYPAPVNIANNLYAQGTICKLVARFAKQGMPMDQAISQTAEEIEGYKRV